MGERITQHAELGLLRHENNPDRPAARARSSASSHSQWEQHSKTFYAGQFPSTVRREILPTAIGEANVGGYLEAAETGTS